MRKTTVHCAASEQDLLSETVSAIERERDFENCVREMKCDEQSDAEIASKLVEIWMLQHVHPIVTEEGNISFPYKIEAAGLGKDKSEQYLDANYWTKCFTTLEYSESFWSELFECNGESHYRNQGSLSISNLIPDKPIHRFVLHFLRDWGSRLHEYILDERIREEERILVLKKQVENFAFFSRQKRFGSHWKMFSEPNDMLRQALIAEGTPVAVRDGEGNLVKGLCGEQIICQADANIPKSAADGPKPDDQDKKIYDYIRRFAVKKLGKDKVHNSWTMVKGSFDCNLKNVRCYAFSGHGHSEKELHKMPLKWWETLSGNECWESDQESHFANVDHLQFGQHLVLALFNALRPSMEEDLKKLALHIAFDEKPYAETLIDKSRKDIGVLDYGEFYDCVVHCVNRLDDTIKKAITGVLKSADDTSTAVERVWTSVSAGLKNKQFKPNKDKLRQSLLESYTDVDKVDKIFDKLCKISEQLLQRLERELDEMPNKFLTDFVNCLQQSKCGEDNVIGLVLRELLLQNCPSFLLVKVQFVALDADNKVDGKPFCGVCARKVKFYSVLPQLLRAIGSTGKDFDQLALLFAKLR